MENQLEYAKELRSYRTGFILALVLSAVAFALVAWGALPPGPLLTTVFVLGLIQILVHFRFFLHIDLSRSKRDDLDLLLFSTLIILLMVGGTLVILFNLHHRMM